MIGAPTLYLYNRFDERLGILPTLGAETHTEELGGEDTIEFDCLVAPEKGERILWRDPDDERRTGPNGERVTHFNLAKCRNGRPCSFDALFEPARMRFTEVGGRAYGRNGR